jgi:hypothetical protein
VLLLAKPTSMPCSDRFEMLMDCCIYSLHTEHILIPIIMSYQDVFGPPFPRLA